MNDREEDPYDHPALEIGAEIIGALDKEFHDAPDLALAIVGGAYPDSLLEALFRAVFVEEKDEANQLLSPTGALGSNGARYQLAYCLGLIENNQRNDLRRIAKICNTFAHRYDVRSFDHDAPKKLLAKLHYGKELDAIIHMLIQETTDPEQQKRFQQIGASGRRKFQDTVRNLFMSLLQRLDCVVRPERSTWLVWWRRALGSPGGPLCSQTPWSHIYKSNINDVVSDPHAPWWGKEGGCEASPYPFLGRIPQFYLEAVNCTSLS